MGKNKNREKKEKDGAPSGGPLAGQARLVDLIKLGDFRAARAEARRVLADPASKDDDKAAARDALGRMSVDKVVLAVGLALLVALATIAIVLLH